MADVGQHGTSEIAVESERGLISVRVDLSELSAPSRADTVWSQLFPYLPVVPRCGHQRGPVVGRVSAAVSFAFVPVIHPIRADGTRRPAVGRIRPSASRRRSNRRPARARRRTRRTPVPEPRLPPSRPARPRPSVRRWRTRWPAAAAASSGSGRGRGRPPPGSAGPAS